MRRLGAVVFALVCAVTAGWTQESTGGTGADLDVFGGESTSLESPGAFGEIDSRAVLAMTTKDYPVTPGDHYTLTYIHSLDTVTVPIIVDNDYTVNLSVFGKMNAEGMTFSELKEQVEETVRRGYPNSVPHLVVNSVGVFEVLVKGEVESAGFAKAWGLTRLAEVVRTRLTRYASSRNVEVVSADGRRRSYDLFRAQRYGEIAQNPYVSSGDTIVVNEAERTVVLTGEVRRAGTYELLRGEHLATLIRTYGGGFTENADPKRIEIRRMNPSGDDRPETLYAEFSESLRGDTKLQDRDVVRVRSALEQLPVAYFEGAVRVELEQGGSDGESEAPARRSERLPYRFRQGETLYTALKAVERHLSPLADLRRAYITREGAAEPIEVDLERLLYQRGDSAGIVLEPFDRIIIPFGVFEVFLTGEVESSAWLSVQSLTRLDAAIQPHLTPYSSIRDVTVTSYSGDSVTYDLFRAQRFGERDQNPYLKPGDTVVVSSLDRKVTIEGEVRRPGTYQLLSGEDLDRLIGYYADGFTENALRSRIQINRYPEDPRVLPQTEYADGLDGDLGEVELRNLDRVTVANKADEVRVVFFEGAVGREISEEAVPETTNEITYRFFEGELLSSAVRKLSPQFPDVADLERSYIVRRGEGAPIPVDLEKLLHDYQAEDDEALEPFDRIIVPFRQFFVTVSGAVVNPGRYPYVTDRSWRYYVNLAGGFDPDRNMGDAVTVTDMYDEDQPRTDPIEPEDKIQAHTNHPLYHFGRFASILSTVVSVATLAISILQLTQ